MTKMLVQTLNDTKTAPRSVAITTSSRLHMGFFDLNGGLGRRFGSIGLSLKTPVTSIKVSSASTFTAEGEGSQRAITIAQKIAGHLNVDGGVHIQLDQVIPEHAGLGSGTQLSLAVGMAINTLFKCDLTVNEIAVLSQRGTRSGIGLGTFATGGLIVDGGRATTSPASSPNLPPVIANAEFPEEWPILLIFDKEHSGVHGDEELIAFQNLLPFPEASAALLCRHVLMQALPAIAERDLPAFGQAIQTLQAVTGDYFAPAQGGSRYTSELVTLVLNQLQANGVHCFGQSSWGPTGFAVFENQLEAETQLKKLNATFGAEKNLQFVLTKANNQPSQILVN
jgi:beta-ribofuranosylaminobenzene 5'-phosphate synthase